VLILFARDKKLLIEKIIQTFGSGNNVEYAQNSTLNWSIFMSYVTKRVYRVKRIKHYEHTNDVINNMPSYYNRVCKRYLQEGDVWGPPHTIISALGFLTSSGFLSSKQLFPKAN